MKQGITTFEYLVGSDNTDFNGVNAFISKYGFKPTNRRMQAINTLKAIVAENGLTDEIKKELRDIHPDKELFDVKSKMPLFSNGDGGAEEAPKETSSWSLKSFFKENQKLIIGSITVLGVAYIFSGNK